MRIKIYAIGKIKENYLKEGINLYLSRIKPYCNIEVIEVNDEAIYDNPSSKDIESVKDKEGKKVLKILPPNEYLIALDLHQKQYESSAFAEYLNKKIELGGSLVSYVIGGSYGLSDELKKRANDSISLSNMTFLHQMSRLILLEQIYRAFKILRNEVYHK